jgi:hypothetical protein
MTGQRFSRNRGVKNPMFGLFDLSELKRLDNLVKDSCEPLFDNDNRKFFLENSIKHILNLVLATLLHSNNTFLSHVDRESFTFKVTVEFNENGEPSTVVVGFNSVVDGHNYFADSSIVFSGCGTTTGTVRHHNVTDIDQVKDTFTCLI